MIDLVVSQVPGADKSVVVPNGMRMGAAAILNHLAPGAGARLELWHGARRLKDADRPRAPVARVVVTRALVGGKGGFGQLLRNLGRAGGGVRTGAEIKNNTSGGDTLPKFLDGINIQKCVYVFCE